MQHARRVLYARYVARGSSYPRDFDSINNEPDQIAKLCALILQTRRLTAGHVASNAPVRESGRQILHVDHYYAEY